MLKVALNTITLTLQLLFRYLTQPAEATQENSPETPRKFKYTRHKTQPITPEEKRDAEIDITVTRSGSLKDR